MSLYVHELMKFEFFLQNMSRSLQTMPQKAPKKGIFGLKIAEQWDFWAKNDFFCMPTCWPMLEEYPDICSALIL